MWGCPASARRGAAWRARKLRAPGAPLRRASPGRGGPDGSALIASPLALVRLDAFAWANAREDANSTASVSNAPSQQRTCTALLTRRATSSGLCLLCCALVRAAAAQRAVSLSNCLRAQRCPLRGSAPVGPCPSHASLDQRPQSMSLRLILAQLISDPLVDERVSQPPFALRRSQAC